MQQHVWCEIPGQNAANRPFELLVKSLEWPAAKLTAWKCDVIGSIFLVLPPGAGPGWRLMQKPREEFV
jgi:hypothetical protein